MEEKTADCFLIGIFKCHADIAYSTKSRSRTSLFYLHERIKAFNSLEKANGFREEPDGWLFVRKGR